MHYLLSVWGLKLLETQVLKTHHEQKLYLKKVCLSAADAAIIVGPSGRLNHKTVLLSETFTLLLSGTKQEYKRSFEAETWLPYETFTQIQLGTKHALNITYQLMRDYL